MMKDHRQTALPLEKMYVAGRLPLNKVVSGLFTLYLLAVLASALIPLGGFSVSMSDTKVVDLVRMDYLLHTLLFIPLFPLWKLIRPHLAWWFLLPAAVLIAVAAELIHLYIPYRGFNINDLLWNVAGVFLGSLLYRPLRRLIIRVFG